LEAKVAELKKVKDGTDASAIKKQMDEISAEIQKVGAAMYQKTEQEQPKADEKKDDSKPEDAQFEEKK